MPEVDPVILKLQADVDGYNLKIDQAQKATDKKLSQIEKSGEEMGKKLRESFNLAREAAGAFVAILAADKITEVVKSGLEYAAALGEQAKQLGVSTAALQEYRFAATSVGLSQEQIDSGLSRLTINIGKAVDGVKEQASAFKALGVDVLDAKGKVLSTADAIPHIATALEKIHSPAQQAALMVQLFGREAGLKLEPLLSQGAAGIAKLRDEAHRLGAVLSEDVIEEAHRAQAELERLNQELRANIANDVARNANAILGLATALEKVTVGALNFISNWPRLSAALAGAAVGARLAGGIGAAVGAGVGVLGGQAVATKQADANMDFAFRQHALKVAMDQLEGARHPDNSLSGMFSLHEGTGAVGLKAAAAEALKQAALMRQAIGLRKEGSADASVFDPAVKAPKVPKAKGAKAGAAPFDSEDHQAEAIARLEEQETRARIDLSTDVQDRADLQKDLLDREREAAIAKINLDKHLSEKDRQAQLDVIDRLYGRPAAVDAQGNMTANSPGLLGQKIDRDVERQKAELSQSQLRDDEATLEAQHDVLTSITERHAIEQRMLDKAQDIEKSQLAEDVAQGRIADAKEAEANLAARQAAAREKLRVDQMSPGQKYQYDLKAASENINDAVQNIEVQGLNALNDGIAQAIIGAKSLGDVFHDVAGQIIGDLLRIAIQKSIIGPLSNMLFGGAGSIGGNTAGLESNFDKAFGHKAIGGAVSAGGNYLVGENGPEIVRMGGGGIVIPNHDIVASSGGTTMQHITVQVDARDAVLTHTVAGWVRQGMQVAAQAGVMGGGAEGERRVVSRGRRRIP